jgi:hypothetical protein
MIPFQARAPRGTRARQSLHLIQGAEVSTSPVGVAAVVSCSLSTGDSDIGGADTGATLSGLGIFLRAGFFAGFGLTLTAGLALVFAAFFGAALAVFLGAALLTFFAGLGFFFFVDLLFATVRFAFATGRFFALLFFFAMIIDLLAVLRLLDARVSSKKSAVICARRWSRSRGLRTLPLVMPNEPSPEPIGEPIRPLHDVWLRPRRVFRELAQKPIGPMDHLLGAAQGIAGWLAFSRAENAGATSSVAEIFGRALIIGGVAGIASLYLMGTIYTRLGTRVGRSAGRSQVFHVMAYGGVPMAFSLIIWLFTALLTGEMTFEPTPRGDLEGFVALLLRVQFITYLLLAAWSVLIQVMGLSEVQALTVRKALAVWALGQLMGFLALLFLMILIATLFPNAVNT